MRRLLILIPLLLAFVVVSPARADVNCSQHVFVNEDDSAHPAELPFTLKLGDAEYSDVFVSTNGTLTFGSSDATYWTYPDTPSVSVAGWDWVTWGDGAYLSFGSTDSTFCAEWSVREYPKRDSELTQIRLMLTRASNGGWHGDVITFGWLPDTLRRGIRFQSGADVVTMDAAFDVNGGVPVEVAPTATPSSFTEPPVEPSPTASPVESPTPTESPTPIETNTPSPSPSDTTVIPSPTPSETVPPIVPSETPSPSATPTETPLPVPTPSDTPSPSETATPTQSPVALQPASPSPSASLVVPSPTASVFVSASPAPSQSANVPMSQSLGQSIQIKLPSFLVRVPGLQSLANAAQAFMNIGSDMTPEQRKKAQQVVVGAIIVNQVAGRKRK